MPPAPDAAAQTPPGRFGYVPLASAPPAAFAEPWRATRRDGADLWARLRAGLRLERAQPNPRIDAKLRELRRDPRFLATFAARAAPYLRVVVGEIERRGLPAELALLPHIESRYNPAATSPKAAAGMWQFIPATGRIMGLRQDRGYDGRRDLLASTRAALDYLERLHRQLGGDWELAMAAYNCGPRRVASAQAANRARGRPTDFWSLDLPAETERYVPRILALARLVAAPSRYGARLPALPDVPQLELVAADGPLDLAGVAQAGSLDLAQLRRLNAGLAQGRTLAGEPARVLVPAGAGRRIGARLAGTRVLPAAVSGDRAPELPSRDGRGASDLGAVAYRVRPGESLGTIARRFGVGVAELRAWNPDALAGVKEGQTLRVFPRTDFAS